jgi:hypothetical protein
MKFIITLLDQEVKRYVALNLISLRNNMILKDKIRKDARFQMVFPAYSLYYNATLARLKRRCRHLANCARRRPAECGGGIALR